MSSCPIYLVDHVESHVARGRNMLIRMKQKKGFSPIISYRDTLYFCLLCGRCHFVCPAGIKNADITISARNGLITENGLDLFQRLVYRLLLAKRSFLISIIRLISFIPGISKKDAPPLRHISDSFFILSKRISIPKIKKPFLFERLSKKKGGEIAFFPGCAFEFIFPDEGERMFYSLEKLGLDIEYPDGIGCCGFPIYSSGDIETAKEIAKRNIDILLNYERIITGCATCLSGIKKYKELFEEDDPYKKKARHVSSKVFGISEFLVKEDIRIDSEKEGTVTYHDPCHLRWHQGIFDEPRKLIGSIKGIRFVEMRDPDMCCGLAGSFGITHREISLELQKRKIEAIKDTGANIVATECPGCMIQIREGIERERLPIKVVHISELI